MQTGQCNFPTPAFEKSLSSLSWCLSVHDPPGLTSKYGKHGLLCTLRCSNLRFFHFLKIFFSVTRQQREIVHALAHFQKGHKRPGLVLRVMCHSTSPPKESWFRTWTPNEKFNHMNSQSFSFPATGVSSAFPSPTLEFHSEFQSLRGRKLLIQDGFSPHSEFYPREMT